MKINKNVMILLNRKSFKCNKNNIGTRTDPRGTPEFIARTNY